MYCGHCSCTDSFLGHDSILLDAACARLGHILHGLRHFLAQVDSEVNVFFPLAHWVMADEDTRLQHLYPLTGEQQHCSYVAFLAGLMWLVRWSGLSLCSAAGLERPDTPYRGYKLVHRLTGCLPLWCRGLSANTVLQY